MIKKLSMYSLLFLLAGCAYKKSDEMVRYRVLKGSYLKKDENSSSKYIVIRETISPQRVSSDIVLADAATSSVTESENINTSDNKRVIAEKTAINVANVSNTSPLSESMIFSGGKAPITQEEASSYYKIDLSSPSEMTKSVEVKNDQDKQKAPASTTITVDIDTLQKNPPSSTTVSIPEIARPIAITAQQRQVYQKALKSVIEVSLPESLDLTVRDGLEYALLLADYQLCENNALDTPLFNKSLAKKLHRLGPALLSDILISIAGRNWQPVLVSGHMVCFQAVF